MAQTGIREAEMRASLQTGERIQHFMVVRRGAGEDIAYVVYLRVSWRPGYHVLLFAHHEKERRFRTFEAVQQFAARFDYLGPMVVYRAGDSALARFRGVLVRDGGTIGPGPGRPPKSRAPASDDENPADGDVPPD